MPVSTGEPEARDQKFRSSGLQSLSKEGKRLWYSWVWWSTSVIPAAEKLRQEDYSEFEVTPVLKEQEELL